MELTSLGGTSGSHSFWSQSHCSAPLPHRTPPSSSPPYRCPGFLLSALSHYPTVSQRGEDQQWSVSLASHLDSRVGTDCVVYISAILYACMYNICTSDSVWMFWSVDTRDGCLGCASFLFLRNFFLCLQSQCYLPHTVANVMNRRMMLPQYCRPSVFDLWPLSLVCIG